MVSIILGRGGEVGKDPNLAVQIFGGRLPAIFPTLMSRCLGVENLLPIGRAIGRATGKTKLLAWTSALKIGYRCEFSLVDQEWKKQPENTAFLHLRS